MSENWLVPYLEGKPKQVVLEARVEGIDLRVPLRPSRKGGMQLVGTVGMGITALAGMWLTLIAVQKLGGDPLMGLAIPLWIGLVALIFPRLVATRRTQLTCDGRTLDTGHAQLPLETIRAVEIQATDFNGCLRLLTDNGNYIVADGLFPGELDWTARLLRDLILRRRAELAGEDEAKAQRARKAAEKLLER